MVGAGATPGTREAVDPRAIHNTLKKGDLSKFTALENERFKGGMATEYRTK
jgi:hypothetical protein